MNCSEVYQWLQAYLDAGVTAEQERAVEAHIRGCIDCRRRLVQLAQAVNALERSEPIPPRAEFTQRLYATLEREAGRPLAPKPPDASSGRRRGRG